MKTTCMACGVSYDDAVFVTICPHERFMTDEDAEWRFLAYSLLGKTVRFAHQPDGYGPDRYVRSIESNGMV